MSNPPEHLIIRGTAREFLIAMLQADVRSKFPGTYEERNERIVSLAFDLAKAFEHKAKE